MTAKTPAQRQADRRSRLRKSAITEVRGIYAHTDDHKAIKQYAAMLQAQRERSSQAAPEVMDKRKMTAKKGQANGL